LATIGAALAQSHTDTKGFVVAVCPKSPPNDEESPN
jgi:hypothetical protein